MATIDRALFDERLSAYLPDASGEGTSYVSFRSVVDQAMRMVWHRLSEVTLAPLSEVREDTDGTGITVSDGRLLEAYCVVEGIRAPAVQSDPDPDITRYGYAPTFYYSGGKILFHEIEGWTEGYKKKAVVAPYIDPLDEEDPAWLPPLITDCLSEGTIVIYLRRRMAELTQVLGTHTFPTLSAAPPTPPTVEHDAIVHAAVDPVTVRAVSEPPDFNDPRLGGSLELPTSDDLPTPPTLPDAPTFNSIDPGTLSTFIADEDPEAVQMELGRMAQELAEERSRLEAYTQELAYFRSLADQRLAYWRSQSDEIIGRYTTERDARLARYQADLQAASAIYQAEVRAYDTDVQMALLEAQLAQARTQANAQIITDTRFRNEQMRQAALLQNYEAALQGYRTDVDLWSTQMQTELARVDGLGGRAQSEARMLAYDLSRAEAAYERAVRRCEGQASELSPLTPHGYYY